MFKEYTHIEKFGNETVEGQDSCKDSWMQPCL